MEDNFSVTEDTSSQGEITQVQASNREARLCLNYVINNGKCDIQDCTYLHICRDYITDSCSRGETCPLNHQFHNQWDKALLSRIRLDQLTGLQLRSLLVSILDDKLSVSGREDDTKCHVHQDKPDACICSEFLIGKCHEGTGCQNCHFSLPYHWQYKVSVFDEWKSFNEKDNLTLEKLYCDVNEGTEVNFKPTQPLVVSRLEREGLFSRDQGYEFMIDLDNMTTKTFQKPRGDGVFLVGLLRRLSTESYLNATHPCKLVCTDWKWHWKDHGSNTWSLYDKDYSKRDLQELIEGAFLDFKKNKRTSNYQFTSPENDQYNLEFGLTRVMYEVNLKTKAKRQVRRRPEKPVSQKDVDHVKRVLACVPSHWSSMPSNTQYIRVSLDSSSAEFKDVEQLFRQTMGDQKKIQSIERVQNPLVWEKYCSDDVDCSWTCTIMTGQR